MSPPRTPTTKVRARSTQPTQAGWERKGPQGTTVPQGNKRRPPVRFLPARSSKLPELRAQTGTLARVVVAVARAWVPRVASARPAVRAAWAAVAEITAKEEAAAVRRSPCLHGIAR